MADGHLLIVEDEAKLSDLLIQNLGRTFSVNAKTTFAQFEETLAQPALGADVVLLDRMMNGHDTFALLGRLKEKFPQARVLVVSAINTPAEKAAALDHGADDYLSKPFAWDELTARIRSLLRRSSREVRFGNVVLDNIDRTAKVGVTELQLSNKEFLLLRVFVQNPGMVFSKQALIEKVWNMSTDVESNSIETTITKLRRKLAEAEAGPQIRNSRKLGYWLEE